MARLSCSFKDTDPKEVKLYEMAKAEIDELSSISVFFKMAIKAYFREKENAQKKETVYHDVVI